MGGYSGQGGMGIAGALLSTGIGAFSQYREVQAANDAAEYNARGYEMQAQSARTRGAFDLSLLKREHEQGIGSMAQGLTNAGVVTSGGSALRMLAEQRGLDERAQQVQKYNTEMEAYGYLQRAALARSQKQSAWGGALQTLVGGFSSTFQQYNKYRLLTGGASSTCGLGSSSARSCGFP